MRNKTVTKTIVLLPIGGQKASLEIELHLHKKSHKGQRTVELEPVPELYWEFSVCGTVYERFGKNRWRYSSGGQNIEEIATLYPDDPQVQRIAALWREWHLNDMNAGTTAQTAFIKQHEADYPDWRYDYSEACEVLKTVDLYIDRGYKYGSAWLLKVMPDEVKKEIEDIIKGAPDGD